MSFSLTARLRAALAGFAVPLVLVAALGAAPALAQGETAPDTVLATVGGEPITEADLAFAAEDLAGELQSVPPAERRAILLAVMIEMKVMANAARAEGLDQTDIFVRRQNYLEDSSLRRAFLMGIIDEGVTDEAVEAAYDEMVARFEPQPELRARHILVPTIEEAQSIRAEIEGGKSFEDAAAEYGTDGTSATGGDLGYFTTGMMVAPFEQAAFALEVGELSQPVQSQFGWHLIKLEDRRVTSAPTLDQVRPQVTEQVLYANLAAVVEGLKSEAEIVIPDEELAAAVEAQGGL